MGAITKYLEIHGKSRIHTAQIFITHAGSCDLLHIGEGISIGVVYDIKKRLHEIRQDDASIRMHNLIEIHALAIDSKLPMNLIHEEVTQKLIREATSVNMRIQGNDYLFEVEDINIVKTDQAIEIFAYRYETTVGISLEWRSHGSTT